MICKLQLHPACCHANHLRSFLLFLLLLLVFHFHAASASASLFKLQHKFTGRNGPYRWSRGQPMSSQHFQDLRSHDRLRHNRLLLSDLSYPLGGTADVNVAGLYFTEIQLGTPPSKFYVQIDTGSDHLWVNCEPCRNCPQSTDLGVRLELYNPQSSSTSSILKCEDTYCDAVSSSQECAVGQPCTYHLGYGDGSSSTGYYVRDRFQLDIVAGNNSVKSANVSVAFGCATNQGGELQQPDQALDGIMGLGQSNISALSQLVNQKQTPAVFAHCLDGESEGGGIFVIGQVQNPALVYTSIIPEQAHYNVNLQSIAVNGKSISVDSAVSSSSDSQGTIIDSGTTLAYFSESIYDKLTQAILAGIPQNAEVFTWQDMNCVAYSGSVDDGFPSVTLTFDGKGATMVIKPHQYLIAPEDNSDNGWCIGFHNPSQTSLALNILGDLALKDRLVVYDLENQRIGWADHNCSSSVAVLSPTGQVDYVQASSIASGGHISDAGILNSRITYLILWLCLLVHM